MRQSLGIMINDERSLACVTANVVPHADCLDQARPVHLGIGFYQDNEVLLHKTPLSDGRGIVDILSSIRSPCLLSHMTDPCGPFDADGLQPYRYRDWLFSFTGRLRRKSGFDVRILAIPSHISANMNLGTDQEIVFHLFLSYLHATSRGRSFSFGYPAICQAMVAALSHLDGYFEPDSDSGEFEYAILATNGDFFVGVNQGRAIGVLTHDGIDRCLRCSDPTVTKDQDPRLVSHPHVRYTLISDSVLGKDGTVRKGWKSVGDRKVFFLDLDGKLTQYDLDGTS